MTGIELITNEREEQLKKHGHTVQSDTTYSENELEKAILFCINPSQFECPYNWTSEFRDKILSATKVKRLAVAGALLAAELDVELLK